MSGWSRTVKPSADTTKEPSDIYGVDAAEVVATPGLTQPGWAHRRTIGSRVVWETLVAMKQAPAEDNADDSVLPDVLFNFTHPVASTVIANEGTTFSVVASTTPSVAVTYKWEASDTETGTFTPVDNGAVYSGTTTATITVIGTGTLTAGKWFRCLVSTAASGAKASNAAKLTVTAPVVTITLQPLPQTVTAPDPATFIAAGSVTGSGNTPTYQWQVSDGGAFANIIGATSATLVVDPTTGLDGNLYRVSVESTPGIATPVISDEVLLTVNPS